MDGFARLLLAVTIILILLQITKGYLSSFRLLLSPLRFLRYLLSAVMLHSLFKPFFRHTPQRARRIAYRIPLRGRSRGSGGGR